MAAAASMVVPHLPKARVQALLKAASRRRLLVVGDVMLDQFIWGGVRRISPEAPVPVVEFQRESFMPGGAANVARNLTALGAASSLFGLVGRDHAADHLVEILAHAGVDCRLFPVADRPTGLKTRVIAHQQHVVRIDRELKGVPAAEVGRRFVRRVLAALPGTDAVLVGDYGKGAVTQDLLDALRDACRDRGIWLSLDPKPVHRLELSGLSLITPNRKEAFELAGLEDAGPAENPLADGPLLQAVAALLADLRPALLLVTLGPQGMLLCRRERPPVHIPTVAREVFDVSGAGDTVIAAFTLAIAAGASPEEAAVFSNHAAGVVVAQVGTAAVSRKELLAAFPD